MLLTEMYLDQDGLHVDTGSQGQHLPERFADIPFVDPCMDLPPVVQPPCVELRVDL